MGRKEDSRKNSKMKERRGRKTKDSKNRISKGDGKWKKWEESEREGSRTEKGRKEERLKGVFGKEIRGKSKRKEKIRIASKWRSEREGKNR